MLDCLFLLRVQAPEELEGVRQWLGWSGCDEVIEKEIHDGP